MCELNFLCLAGLVVSTQVAKSNMVAGLMPTLALLRQ